MRCGVIGAPGWELLMANNTSSIRRKHSWMTARWVGTQMRWKPAPSSWSNIGTLWIFAIILICLVLAQSFLFLRLAMRFNRKHKLVSVEEVKEAVSTGAVAGPSWPCSSPPCCPGA